MRLLVVDADGARYKERLAREFPDIHITATNDLEDGLRRAGDADALVAFGFDLRRIHIDRLTRLRWIQALSTGTDQFEPLLAGRDDVLLTSGRGVHGPAVSELVFLLMLSLARGMPRMLLNQRAGIWSRTPGGLLFEKTIGVVGVGVIGREVLLKARAFGMNTVALGSVPREVPEAHRYVLYDELERVIPGLDFLIMIAPARPDTQGMISSQVFAAMRPDSYFINVGRGCTVDEAALIEALRHKRIAGAGLDTFNSEPLPADSPLWAMDNVIMTPHAGGFSDRYVADACAIIAHNLRCVRNGELSKMINRVERWK